MTTSPKMDDTCEHYECRCARARELAAMDNGNGRMTMLALEVHEQRVPCLKEDQDGR